MSSNSNKRKRKKEESEDSSEIEIISAPNKKRKLSLQKHRPQKTVKFVFVVLRAGHQLGTGSDYMADSMLKETFDTEIVDIFKSKTEANKCAADQNEEYCLEDISDAQNDTTLSFYEGTWENCDYGNETTRIWVEQHPLR
eukprot:115528_1